MHTLLHALPGVLLALAAVGYGFGMWRVHRRGRRWPWWRGLSFAAGLCVIAAALAPPVAAFAHHDFRGHMWQHLLLGMVAPLGLVFAAPVTLALNAAPVSAARRLGGLLHAWPVWLLGHPVSALVLNVGGMYLLYLTPLYALSRTSAPLHALVHWHFIAAGYLFIWAIAGPDPAPRRAGMNLRLIVLFLGMGLHAALGKLMYAHLWPRDAALTPEEIRAGAQLMYYGGDLAELALAIALFALWFRAQAPGARRSAVRS